MQEFGCGFSQLQPSGSMPGSAIVSVSVHPEAADFFLAAQEDGVVSLHCMSCAVALRRWILGGPLVSVRWRPPEATFLAAMEHGGLLQVDCASSNQREYRLPADSQVRDFNVSMGAGAGASCMVTAAQSGQVMVFALAQTEVEACSQGSQPQAQRSAREELMRVAQ